jgi:hypothetical protein
MYGRLIGCCRDQQSRGIKLRARIEKNLPCIEAGSLQPNVECCWHGADDADNSIPFSGQLEGDDAILAPGHGRPRHDPHRRLGAKRRRCGIAGIACANEAEISPVLLHRTAFYGEAIHRSNILARRVDACSYCFRQYPKAGIPDRDFLRRQRLCLRAQDGMRLVERIWGGARYSHYWRFRMVASVVSLQFDFDI